MKKDDIVPIILIVMAVALGGYLCLYAMTDAIDEECISQNATWNNITKMWDGCEINALAESEVLIR